ncbi:MAG: glycoside hydrolase [Bacteroidales bacterium]|nr:glycoside hydrolase [Bacteroidales bacterium]
MRKILMFLLINAVINSMTTAQHRNINWEKFKSSGPELRQVGWLATKSSKEIKSSSWSVGCETLDRDYAQFSVYKNWVGELGVKHGRLQSGWAKCEKQKGIYSFEWLDSCVYGLSEQAVKPWICLCYGNPVYGSGIRLGAKIFTDEAEMTAWFKYVEATVLRYKNVVTEWEIWNEPNGGGGLNEYANLLIRTAETIKKVQPDAVIMGFSLAGIDLKYAKEIFEILKANNKLNIIDYLTYHPYTNNPDESYADVDKLQSMINSYNPKIKLYQGENGCPSQLEWTHALAYYPWTEISQAKWFMRRMAGDRVRDIPSSVFTIIDLRYYNMLQSFGLIRSNLLHEFIYKRPSYYGVQHIAGFFDDSARAQGELKYESNTSRKIAVAGFKKEGSPIVLIWYKDQIPGDDLKWDLVDITIKGTNFKDPVYVEMITGKVYEINKAALKNKGGDVSFSKLPVWDSPVMIAERLQVKLGSEPDKK